VRKNQRRPLHLLNDVGHGEGLARSRDTQQNLVFLPLPNPSHERFDRLWLISRRGKRAGNPKFWHEGEPSVVVGQVGADATILTKQRPQLLFINAESGALIRKLKNWGWPTHQSKRFLIQGYGEVPVLLFQSAVRLRRIGNTARHEPGGNHRKKRPPFKSIMPPVMKRDASDARNNTA
jgi:hypothetical protein